MTLRCHGKRQAPARPKAMVSAILPCLKLQHCSDRLLTLWNWKMWSMGWTRSSSLLVDLGSALPGDEASSSAEEGPFAGLPERPLALSEAAWVWLVTPVRRRLR